MVYVVAQMLVTCSWVGSCIWFNFDLDELDAVDADADARSFVREERIRNRWADERWRPLRKGKEKRRQSAGQRNGNEEEKKGR